MSYETLMTSDAERLNYMNAATLSSPAHSPCKLCKQSTPNNELHSHGGCHCAECFSLAYPADEF